MYQNSLFPLRTIVGDAIPIEKSSIQHVFDSPDSKELGIKYEHRLKASIIDTRTDPEYARYLPTFVIDGKTYSPGEGMVSLPVPTNLPFGNNDKVISLSALSHKEATTDVSRKLSTRYSFKLPGNYLVGGICFGGFPYLSRSPRQTPSKGEYSTNFGLPREVRLTCVGATTTDQKDAASSFEFLDSEISATKQEIVSHSGFHYLCIDPTLTNIVTVHFSDYPRILTKAKLELGKNNSTYNETIKYGFIIPYFYIFEYKEMTRYRPVVSAGLLGTTTNEKSVAL